MTIRELQVFELPLLLEGGTLFFKEGAMPGGFDPDHFLQRWAVLVRDGIGHVFGLFNEEQKITGALAWIVSSGLFSKKTTATEALWYVIPQYRGDGLILLAEFEAWCKKNKVDLIQMVHLIALQPERLCKLYISHGYTELERVYVKEVV